MAGHSPCPVINGLTDYSHPCQAMADLLTVREAARRVGGQDAGLCGRRQQRGPRLALACAKLGMKFVLSAPAGYELETAVVRTVQAVGGEGCYAPHRHDPVQAVARADVIYTDTWVSMGQEAEAERRTVFPYQVNARAVCAEKPDAIFMHCLPAHRGEEVTDDVIDFAPVVFDQAENRLHVQKAIMVELMAMMSPYCINRHRELRLIRAGEKGTIDEQLANTRRTARAVVGLIQDGFSLVLTHGTGRRSGLP